MVAKKQQAVNKALESGLLYRTIFNQSPDGILIIDPDGAFIEFNEAAHRQLGYSREEFEKLRISDIDPIQDPDEIQASIKKLIEEGSAAFEVKHRAKDGDIRDVQVISQLITISGEIYFHTIWRDITEHKRTDIALQESEHKFRTLFETANDAIFILDLEGHFIDINRIGYERLGYTKDEMMSMHISQLDTPEFAAQVESRIEQLRKYGQAVIEVAHRRKDGTIMPVESNVRIMDFGGRKVLFSIGRDITGRKKAEAALKEANAKLQTLIRALPDAVYFKDTNCRYLMVNRVFEEMLGAGQEAFMGKTDEDFMPPDLAGSCRMSDEALMKSGAPVNVVDTMIGADGKKIYLDSVKAPIHDSQGVLLGIVGVSRDVTERKLAEDSLKQSEEKYRELVETANSVVLTWDTTGRITFLNTFAEQFFGFSKAELLGENVVGTIVPRAESSGRDLARLMEEIQHDPNRFKDNENENITKDGARVWVRWANKAIMDEEGKIIGILSIGNDITARRDAESRLWEREKFISTILDTVDEGFIVLDRDYRILTANKAYGDQVGGVCDAIIGKHCYEVSHKSSRPCYEEGEDCASRHVFETGKPYSAIHKHTDAKGRIMYVETKAFPIKSNSGAVTSVIETINNISERYLLEEERLKTQKLESIGVLAGGIAHDFNNLMQGIFGYISLAKITHDQKEKSLAMLEHAEKALHQSVNLTTQLLTFSKGGKPAKKRLDLHPVIEDSIKFILSGSRSEFRTIVPEDLWQTEADAGQVGQVIQNIVLNADQSMPMGGSVSVTAKNVAAGDASLPYGLAMGNYVMISIRDTGIGIPEQNLGKIFDPYFTTKEHGSGLGLATSYSIIRNHGGMIDIRTKPGEGSTFMVYLPAIAREGRAESQAKPVEKPAPLKARVLVMDDDETIQNLSRELLLALGQEVEIAKDGQEALEKYKGAMASGKRFDIVILDLTIRGGMGGAETLQRLMEIDPAVKAVVSSGYSDDALIAGYQQEGFKAFLKKPYGISALRDTLFSLMAGGQRTP